MFRYLLTVGLLLITATGAIVAPHQAQEATELTVVVDNLCSQRNLSFGPDGTLYIAESGCAATTDSGEDSPLGRPFFGADSHIGAISPEGEYSVFLKGFLNTGVGEEFAGVHAVQVTDEAIWVLLAGAAGNVPLGNGMLVGLNPETLRPTKYVDLVAYEIENNPDGAEINSNPIDFVIGSDGVFYIADAGANAVYTWKDGEDLAVFARWKNSVPTSLALTSEGDVMIGFLTPFPFTPGSAKIERYSAAGELLNTYEGFNPLTDLAVAPDGTVYGLEFAAFNLPAGWAKDTGRLVRWVDSEVEVVREALNFPWGIIFDREGNLIFGVNAINPSEAQGKLLKIAAEDLQ